MKKVFLTGGSGFLGRNILEGLGRKYQIIAPTHKELNLMDTETVEGFFKKHKHFYCVLHCAGAGGTQGTQTAENFYKTLKIFFNIERNKRYFNKLITIGSGAEYGKDLPIKKVKEIEFGKRLPQDYYGFAKYIIGKYIEK